MVWRLIKYEYYSYTLGCECCSESSSTYDLWEDGELVGDVVDCPLCENEEDLRKHLAHLEPFDVHSDSVYW